MIDFTKKISFIIENENEWIRCQKFLFERGYNWQHTGKDIYDVYYNSIKSIDININFKKCISFSYIHNPSIFDNIIHFKKLDRKQKLNKILNL